jgi:hypothetical protein
MIAVIRGQEGLVLVKIDKLKKIGPAPLTECDQTASLVKRK